jgi:Mg2+/citrate symporter
MMVVRILMLAVGVLLVEQQRRRTNTIRWYNAPIDSDTDDGDGDTALDQAVQISAIQAQEIATSKVAKVAEILAIHLIHRMIVETVVIAVAENNLNL